MTFSKEEKEKILADCYQDPVLFNKTFLHDHFYLDPPWVHRGILAILDRKANFLLKYGELRKIVENFVHETEEFSRQIFHVYVDGEEVDTEVLDLIDTAISQGTFLHLGVKVEVKLDLGPFTLLILPRGISKTTLAGLAIPVKKICYQEDRFTLYVSKAGLHSQGQLESVRKELSGNPVIQEFFGDLKPQRSDDERWSKEKFETATGVAMQYRGKGSAIRGVNHNNFRPSTIIVDDPQSKDDIKSDMVREDDKKWAFAELTPARALLTESTITVLGTFLGADCLVDVWSRDPRFTTVKLEVIDRDGDFLWPAYMDQHKYDMEKQAFARAGLLSDFYKEYHNKDVQESELPFPRRFIQHDPVFPEGEAYVTATYADLATSEKREADYTAIVTARLFTNGLIFVLDAHIERGMPEEEKIDEYFRQSITWKSDLHGFESNAYQAVFGTLLNAEMYRRGHYFEALPILHKTRKIDRVRGALRPRYAGGFIKHRIPFVLLETQLHDFRYDDSHMHDDGPDALAACLVLLDPAAAFHAGEDPTIDRMPDIDDWIGDENVSWAH